LAFEALRQYLIFKISLHRQLIDLND